jgi:hypothetical protein
MCHRRKMGALRVTDVEAPSFRPSHVSSEKSASLLWSKLAIRFPGTKAKLSFPVAYEAADAPRGSQE